MTGLPWDNPIWQRIDQCSTVHAHDQAFLVTTHFRLAWRLRAADLLGPWGRAADEFKHTIIIATARQANHPGFAAETTESVKLLQRPNWLRSDTILWRTSPPQTRTSRIFPARGLISSKIGVWTRRRGTLSSEIGSVHRVGKSYGEI